MDFRGVTVRALVACAKKYDLHEIKMRQWMGLSRMKNKEGDTAVHEVTRYNHVEVVTLLLDEDPHFNPPTNKSGESPLYLAARRGFHDLIDVIIEERKHPSYDGPNGRTALHGAVLCNSKDCVTKLLEWDKTLVRVEDKYSQTPLHYVARLGFADLALELLSANASIAYFANNANKNTALLVAASAGHVSVVKELISNHPGCGEIVNAQGRNILHIAIEHEQKDVIQYLLDECSSLISSLIIQKDIDGNKPLHLLATTSNCSIPNLIQHPMADKNVLQDNDTTSLDFVSHHNDIKSSTSATKNDIVKETNHVGAISLLPNAPTPAPAPLNFFDKLHIPKSKTMVNNHMIVAALIATVAFTAGFAMPGGYISSGSPNQGSAVLSRNSIAFQAFVISDAIALLFSTGALFTYIITAFYNQDNKAERKVMVLHAIVGMVLNIFALGAIIVAFITGTYAVLQYSYALAIATSVVVSSIFLVTLVIMVT